EGGLRQRRGAGAGGVAGEVGAVVAGAVDQRVHGLAVGLDGGRPYGAVGVGLVMRLGHEGGACRAGVLDALVHVGHLEGDVDDAGPVTPVVVGDEAAGRDGALDDEPDVARAQHVGV